MQNAVKHLAGPAVESSHAVGCFCFLFISTIPARPIISTLTGRSSRSVGRTMAAADDTRLPV